MAKSLEGLHPVLMRPRVEALLADPDAQALGLYVVSAFRSDEYQQVLWQGALAKYGDPEIADNWVARPGTSRHGPRVDGYGTAVDLGLPGVRAVSGKWPVTLKRQVEALTLRYGLYSPLSWEDWHHEPIRNFTLPASAVVPPSTAEQEEPMEWIVAFPGHDPVTGRHAYVKVDREGHVFAYNGAPDFPSLEDVSPDFVPPVTGVDRALDDDGRPNGNLLITCDVEGDDPFEGYAYEIEPRSPDASA